MEIFMIVNNFPQEKMEAVVFDLDATLMDTEDNWYLADKKMMAEYGVDFTEKMKEQFIGVSIDDMLDDLMEQHQLNVDKSELYEKKNRYYLDIALDNTVMFPEIEKVFYQLVDKKIPLAIASGTALHVIEEMFQRMDLRKYFQFILSAEQVPNGKPAPDIYLEAAERLAVDPEKILVFEDSVHGVESAKKAGLFCVAIPFPAGSVLKKNYFQADIIFEKGMEELNWNLLEKFF
jgi:HAD superfamily hydrolase (TIGR01509 family)